MNRINTVLNAELIRARTIEANSLHVKQLRFWKKCGPKRGGGTIKINRALLEKIHSVKHGVRELKHELHKDFRRLQQDILRIKREILPLQQQMATIQQALESGLISNPALEAFVTSKLNQIVTVTTPSGAITGTVVVIGTDAVELREINGDLVVIPYSKITSAS